MWKYRYWVSGIVSLTIVAVVVIASYPGSLAAGLGLPDALLIHLGGWVLLATFLVLLAALPFGVVRLWEEHRSPGTRRRIPNGIDRYPKGAPKRDDPA